MRIPDITATINNVQRNTVPSEDIPLICASVQFYWKHLFAIGATHKNVNVTYEAPKNDLILKHLDKLNKNELIEVASCLSIVADMEMTKEEIIKKIKGE